jgi:hypothetical protein
MKTIGIFLPALLWISTSGPCFAQDFGEIRGKVLGQDGKPLWLVNVYIERPEGLIGDVTDEEGRYLIKPLPAGTYNVHFSFVGLEPFEERGVRVDPGKTRFLQDMTLTPKTLAVFEVPFHLWEPPLIDPEDPVKMTLVASHFKHDAQRKDPISMITTFAPGIYKSPNSDDLYFRGARPENMAYYVDGVKSTGLSAVPPQSIASVTVYTGGLPAKYGDVTGGVIAIETQSYFDLYRQRMAGLR